MAPAGRPLLLNRHQRRMTTYNVQYLVGSLCRQIGVAKRITPHRLRHSAITIALDAGVSLRDVQDFARHDDPRTTRTTQGRSGEPPGNRRLGTAVADGSTTEVTSARFR